MADNVGYTPGSGETVATDDIGGVQFQRIKVTLGADGINAGDVSASNPMPVTGPLTDAQLRAVAVPVSGTVTATGPLTDAQLRATAVPVSGPLTDAQLRASPVTTQVSSPPFVRVGFAEVGSGLQGLAASELTLVQTGAGMAVSQSSSNLVITTGTTANSETVIRSNATFRGALLARYKAILSQRIANQTFRFELADLIGSGLAYTINSATSVTVTFPSVNPFAANSVGQSCRLSVITGAAGVPGRYAIASVSGLTVTFTVAGWPASGSGTLTIYGHNWLAAEYSGATATNVSFDAQRRGWNSGNTTATINTTASPGHVGQITFDVLSASYGDSLVATNTGYQWTNRASRIENIPDEDVELHFFIVVQNGSVAPASTTTLTVGFIQVEDQPRQKIRIAGADPSGGVPAPVQVLGGTTTVTGTVTTAPAAGANLIGDVGLQVRANATGAATIHHIVSAATTNVLQIKATAGRVLGWSLANNAASWRYVKLHNVASATAGAAVAMTIGIPPNGTNTRDIGTGIGFATAISRSVVAGAADADATAIGANEVVGDIFFA